MISTPSSSAQIPSTSPQVTASVVKFRCLYTHDLRRKSKRWHDGYLRYHKFNKRVMVYDDQGNFIGDHHWRSTDEVQDGDEMELDKGVLIEVTENMGTTETDITTLYEKKISSQNSPQAKDPVSQAPHTSTYTPASAPLRSSASSQSFRSLNDLLGIKKTPIGHLVSPYEQRNPSQPTLSSHAPERSPKRQKTSLGVGQPPEKGPLMKSRVIDLTESNHGAPMRKNLITVREGIHGAAGDSTTDMSPANRQQRTTVQSKRPQPQRLDLSSSSRIPASAPSDPIPSLPTPEEPHRTSTKDVRPARPAIHKSKYGPPQMQPPKPSGAPSKELSSAVPPETESFNPQRELSSDQLPVNLENQSKNVSRLARQRRPGPPTVSKCPFPSPHQLSKYPSIPQAPVRSVANYVQPIETENNPSSTNVPSSTGAPSSTNVPPSNNMPPPSRPSLALPSGPPTTALRMGNGKPRKKLMYSALLPGMSRTPLPATSDTPPNNVIRGPATKSPEQQATVASSNSSTVDEFTPSSSTQFIFDEMMDGSGFKSSATLRTLTGRRGLDSPLRKSISGPTALTSHHGSANNEYQPEEQGPWTSEALDLFDFWPVGRPKPTD